MDPIALTRELVRLDSRNPTLVPGGPGELACARFLASTLSAAGFRVEMHEAAPGRPNVVARIGRGDGPTIMLNGHLDVVGTEGMSHAPFAAEERDGRIYGRGSADMKAGVAAMCAAALRAGGADLAGEVIIAAVCDEEYESLGTRALLERGVRADVAIVTEPTRLTVMPAHRGFVWTETTFRGRAAHGSRYDVGIDAIRHAALVLSELDAHERDVLVDRTHPLLGRASLHASTIEGGVGMSTYPERCVLAIERRTIPGETTAMAVAEVEDACARVRARVPALDATVRLLTAQGPSDVPASSPLVHALLRAAEHNGLPPRVEGMSAWTDCALLNDAGIPAICFGPGDIALAHAATEYVPVDEIERATDVLARLLATW